MDKQKEIEEMTKIVKDNASRNLLDGYVCTVDDDITALVYAGYGDVKQAIIEYADELASHIAGHSDYHGDNILSAIYVLAEGREIKDVKYLNIEEIKQQAVREFAEKLKDFLKGAEIYFYNGEEEGIWDSEALEEKIDELVKEICKE